ncbi:MAG: FkbM family methyltransferase [Alphaproteobacteria bacterium]|nr:FkbM family methyltransferase [Alphaproteobacteria bacterium]
MELRYLKRRRKAAPAPSAEAVIARLLAGRPRGTVFDIGANAGRFTKAMVRDLSPARVHAFEADRENFALLCGAVADLPSVTPHHLAMGETPGEQTFHINAARIYNNSLLPSEENAASWANIDHVGSETVRVVTVDSFCEAHGIDELDVLKINAEGADLMILKGASRALAGRRIAIVYCEVLLKPIFAGQGRAEDFLRLMDGYGYEFFNVFGGRTSGAGQLIQTNMMFVRPDLTARTAM